MLKQMTFPLIAAAIALASIAMAYTSGGLGDPNLDYAYCVIFYMFLLILILFWLIYCIISCDQEDRNCTTVCIRRASYAWVVASILLFLCFAHAGGHF